MSGENKRFGSWVLPVLVILVGAYFLVTGTRTGTLRAAALKPANWFGIALMVAGLAGAFLKKPMMKLLGVLLCGVGAILVICL